MQDVADHPGYDAEQLRVHFETHLLPMLLLLLALLSAGLSPAGRLLQSVLACFTPQVGPGVGVRVLALCAIALQCTRRLYQSVVACFTRTVVAEL